MTQQTSPFIEGKYGWSYGENGWNAGMDENLIKFSYLFDSNVDGIVSTLPTLVNGQAYFLSTDNRIYFAVGGNYYSTPIPKWYVLTLRTDGTTYQYNGSALNQITSNTQLSGQVSAIQTQLATYGTAATKNIADFATPASVTTSLTQAKAYTDTLQTNLDGDTGASYISYTLVSVAGAVRTGLESLWTQTINAAHFGMLGDGTDITTKLQQLRDYVASLNKRVKVQFPAGNYVYSTSPNWAIRGLVFDCLGEVFFTNTGTGYAFILDGGATSPARVDDFCIGSPSAPLTIRGGSTTGGGVYARAILTSDINIRCYGCGTSSAGLRTEWCVLVNFNVRVSPNDLTTGTEAWYQGGKPSAGYSLGQRNTGEQTSYCRFNFPFVASCGTGIYLDSTLGNIFIGGDSEYNTSVGLLTTANALNDLFIKMNFEQNPTDMSLLGKYTEFVGCDSVTIVVASGAKNIQLKGGNTDSINIQSGALDTLISEVKYGRGLTGSVITNAGTRTRRVNNFNLATGKGENAAKTSTSISVTAAPFTYTNTTGNTIAVSVAGGAGVAISYVTEAGGVNSLGQAAGQFFVLPSDSIRLTAYTTAPTMIAYEGF